MGRRSPVVRTANFIMRVTPAERDMMNALAEANGVTASDIVRVLVRREYMRQRDQIEELVPGRRHRT